MRSSNAGELVVRRSGSLLRTILIILALAPAWHLMCRDLFNFSARVAMGSTEFRRAQSLPYPADPIDFISTAYSEKGITKSGIPVASGLVAADPHVLPLGSWIMVEGPLYSGIYQVMDTGRLVKGKRIDIYLPTTLKAINYGLRKVKVTVLKYGPMRRKPTLLAL